VTAEPLGTRLSVYAFVVDEGRVLLTQVSERDPDAGHWTLPGGGVDWGEHPIDALHRELYEETGLQGDVVDLLGINSIVFDRHERTGMPPLHAVRLVYRVEASGEPEVIEAGGTTADAAWFATERLSALPMVSLVTWALEAAGDSTA
jgi:8-oxo-dGTP diphosphatase